MRIAEHNNNNIRINVEEAYETEIITAYDIMVVSSNNRFANENYEESNA